MTNKIQNAFDNVKADSRLIESTKQAMARERRKRGKLLYRPGFQGALAAVCMALFLAAGFGGYSWLRTPIAYVSIDVNPSIDLALNRFDRVLSATAYNAEAEEILADLSVKGKKYTEAIDLIVKSEDMKPYLTKDAELVLTVAADDGRKEKLQEGIKNCYDEIGYKGEGVSADMKTVSEAHDHGLSVGKYHAWQQLSQYDDSVTPEDCKEMSMSEIHGRIKEHMHGSESDHEQKNSRKPEHEQQQEHRQESPQPSKAEHHTEKKKHHQEHE